MKGPVRDPATFSFNAAARTVTFAAPIPAQQAYILGILNITRNTFIYLPVKPGSGGSYSPGTGVLTLAFDTTTHANGDVLQVIFDDTQSGATAALQVTGNTALVAIDTALGTANINTAGIRTDLGTDGTSPPSLPGGSTGVRGWLRYVASLIPADITRGSGVIDANTQRVTLATDGTAVTNLSSINTKTPALVNGRQPVDGSGVVHPISASALPLPSGASTSALQTTGNTSLSTGNTNTAGIRTDLGTDGTSPPSLPGGSTGVRGWLRYVASLLASIDAKTAGVRTPTTTSVASSASSATLLAANASRRGLDIFNNSTATLWISYTTPAEIPGTSAFAIDPGGSLTRDAQLIGTGALYGIWTSANGTAQVTEWV